MEQPIDRGAFFGYPATDRTRWRLKVERGRQTWIYLKTEEETVQWPQTDVERYWLGLPMPDIPRHEQVAKTPLEAAHRGFSFLSRLQTEDGHWACEYGGPMFLIPGLVIACHVCNVPFDEEVRVEIIRYLIARANADGGWGIHIEGASTVFGTATNYAAIRLLGMPASHPVAVAARKTLHALGGAVGAPAWGKFWLSVLGVYDWKGMNPVPPELWILPYGIPIHPGRMWCHTRMVYLPMGYCYGRRVIGPDSEIVQQLRTELYTERYEDINWGLHCNNVSSADLYSPHTTLYRACNIVLRGYETIAAYAPMLRERAIKETLRQMKMEDNNTEYADLGPVNKAMNMLCMWHAYGPDSEEFKRHIPRLQDFLWLTPEGILMNGTNGAQVWDTSFVVQCAIDARLLDTPRDAKEIQNTLSRAHDFIETSQFVVEIPNYEECYRYPRRGGWPFSNLDQGYSVSDTTAEAMKTIIMLQKETSLDLPHFERRRLEWAVTLLLGMQSANGGFPSYEPIRGPAWLEKFNPAEVFGDIMIEYDYPECTTAVVTGLLKFRQYFPDFKSDEISICLQKAHKYIISAQRPEGGWFGSWAICFTYATMFALESLNCVGETWENSTNVRRACDFLVSKQNPDGGWGESYRSCERGEYVQHPDGSQVVNTSWAVMALMYANIPIDLANGALRRGIDLIMQRQLPTGEWAQEGIEGVFNRNCAISYSNYKLTFPIWALGRYTRYSKRKQSCTESLSSEE